MISVEAEDIRGIPLTSLLSGFGRLFARGGAMAREQPEFVYSCSRQVETLDAFVSHSWAASRIQKFVALLMYFNAWPVYLCCFFMATCMILLELHYFERLMPDWLLVEMPDNLNDRAVIQTKYLILPTISVLVPVLLLNWHRVSGCGRKSLFLDIACICQNDAAKKARGIESLGALLDRSETMIVLLDESYFTRLWCAFEVACFAKRAGAHRLKIIPMQQPLAEFAATMMWALVHPVIFATLLLDPGQFRGHHLNSFIFLCIIGPSQAIVIQAFISGQRAAAALAALKTFSLDKCECYSDRDALLTVIANWYADPASAHLPEERQRAIGRHRFENYVQHDLRLQLLAAAGPGDRLSAEAIQRIGFYTCLSYFDLIASPQVGLPKLLTILACVMLGHCFTTPLMYRILAWSASLITRLQRAGWHSALAWTVGLAGGGAVTMVMCTLVFNLSTVGSMLGQGITMSADDGLTAEQRIAAKQQVVLVGAMAGGLRMRN